MNRQEQSHRQQLITLLRGDLSQEERDRFDERLLTDDEFSKALQQAEFLLLEEYADGTLSGGERAVIEALVAKSSECAQHVLVTRALRNGAKRSRVLPWPKVWALAAAACLLCSVSIGLLLHRAQRPAVRTEVSQSNPVPKRFTPGEPLPPPDTILLTAQRVRSGGAPAPPIFRIHAGAPVRLQVVVTGGSQAAEYALDLHPTGMAYAVKRVGMHVQHAGALAFVEATLPPGTLTSANYTGQLKSNLGSYALQFAVEYAP